MCHSFIFVMLCNLFANREYLEKFSALQKIWKSDVQLLPIYHDEWSNPLYTFDSFHVSWLFVFDSMTASLMNAALETSRREHLLDVRVSLNATQTGVIEMKVHSQSRRYTNSCGEMTGAIAGNWSTNPRYVLQTCGRGFAMIQSLSVKQQELLLPTEFSLLTSFFVLLLFLSFIKWVTLYLGPNSDK